MSCELCSSNFFKDFARVNLDAAETEKQAPANESHPSSFSFHPIPPSLTEIYLPSHVVHWTKGTLILDTLVDLEAVELVARDCLR